MKNKTKNIRYFLSAFFVLAVFFAAIFFSGKTLADDDLEDLQDEYKKLEEKAAAYEKMLLLKQKQKSLLGTQISDLNSKIAGIKNEITDNANRIDELNKDIDDLETDIAKNESLIGIQRRILSDMLRDYYDSDSSKSSLNFVFNLENFSDFYIKEDYVSQINGKILDVVDNLRLIQERIKESKKELENEKKDLVEARNSLEEKNADLASTRSEKNTLLVQTEGDEAKYQAKLDKLEKQKQELLGDINELYNANADEISEFADSLEKPDKKYWAKTSWYYSQKDSRWKNETIGNSKTKLEDYGCAVSSTAMVFTYHGEAITPKQLADQSIYYWDLISWPKTWKGLTLSSSTSHSGVSWNTIDKEIKNGNPVIVFIKARSGAGHYVVIHTKTKDGDYVVHDPYFGSNIYLDSTVKLLGKLYGVSISTSRAIDQMILYK